MATWVYNKDRAELVEPEHLEVLLKNGWTVEDPKAPKKQKKKVQPEAD